MADGTVLIVGGTGGIGRELAAHYIDRGREVIITGRDAPPELVEISDLVSEVNKVKHPFDEGYRGQKGIEW